MYFLIAVISYGGIFLFAERVRKVSAGPWLVGAAALNVLAYLFGNLSDTTMLVWSALVGVAMIMCIAMFSQSQNIPARMKKCAYCAEPILEEAKLCKHCGKEV